VCVTNLFLLTANNLDGLGLAHTLMEAWFPRREYAVGQAPQGHSYDRICCRENDPGQSLIGKLRCVRYPIYMTSVLQRSVMTMSCSRTEKGTQLRLDTVCWAPTTQNQSPPRGLVNSPAHTYMCALT